MPNTNRQLLFQELLIGSLIYTVVFGFFNDYTDILTTYSYSTTFLASLVMMAMTFPAFRLKSHLAKKFRKNTSLMILSIWGVMFFSKFIFLGTLDLIFGNYIYISGFVGLVLIIATATILQKLTNVVYHRLAPTKEVLELG